MESLFQYIIAFSATKPKSAIDDLFADVESEEDSDDIFSSKSTITKKRANETSNNANTASAQDTSKKCLDVITPEISSNITTSTPQSYVNVPNLFSDDENDDGDLFAIPKKQSQTLAANASSTYTAKESNKKVNC